MVTPVPVPDIIKQVDIWVMLAAALAITPFILGRGHITRAPGIAFVAIYIAYIFFAFTPRAEELASLYR